MADRTNWSREDWERAERQRGGCFRIVLILVLISVILLSVGLILYNYSGQRMPEPAPPPSSAPPASSAPSDSPERLPVIGDEGEFDGDVMTSGTVRDIVAQCGDAVVLISTETVSSGGGYGNPFFNDPFFNDFFNTPQTPRTQVGTGSGFLFREDGYILTNHHVIEGADTIHVYLTASEEPYVATVIGQAPELDLAVIKIEGGGFPYLTLGDSDEAYVGDWVVAIGNPYGLDHTVTVGVISAMGRPLTIGDTMYQNLLQTDAAINPGNSGGPMLNLRGEVIGINTAVNASAQGIGFAIPTSTVMETLEDLEAGQDRVKPWVGVSMLPMSREWLQHLDLQSGVMVDSVVAGSPAEKADIRGGDVLLSVDGQTITSTSQVQGVIASHKAGDAVTIGIYRDGQNFDVVVELEESPPPEE